MSKVIRKKVKQFFLGKFGNLKLLTVFYLFLFVGIIVMAVFFTNFVWGSYSQTQRITYPKKTILHFQYCFPSQIKAVLMRLL